jgi:hypothetical protein
MGSDPQKVQVEAGQTVYFLFTVSFCFGFVKDLQFIPAFRTHRSSVVTVEPTYFRV